MTRSTSSSAAKRYYQGGVKVSVGGVPCRMARKPGEFYSKAVREGQHGFDKVSLKTVRAAEARYARECLEALSGKLPKAPKATGGVTRGVWSWTAQKAEEKLLAAWDAECVSAYLKALEKAGRPQTITDVVDESEPMLDLEPVTIVETAEVVEAVEPAKVDQPFPPITSAKPTMTHLSAKALYGAGEHEKAWEVARLDEGLSPAATRQAWEAFMVQTLSRDHAASLHA